MIKTYSKEFPKVLLNIVYSMGELNSDRQDITDQGEFLQCAIMKAESKSYKPHRHLTKELGIIQIQEVFILMKGQMEIDIYDLDDSYIETLQMNTGDLSILLNGGHSVKVKDEAVFYEVKTGPYEGQKKDKAFL